MRKTNSRVKGSSSNSEYAVALRSTQIASLIKSEKSMLYFSQLLSSPARGPKQLRIFAERYKKFCGKSYVRKKNEYKEAISPKL